MSQSHGESLCGDATCFNSLFEYQCSTFVQRKSHVVTLNDHWTLNVSLISCQWACLHNTTMCSNYHMGLNENINRGVFWWSIDWSSINLKCSHQPCCRSFFLYLSKFLMHTICYFTRFISNAALFITPCVHCLNGVWILLIASWPDCLGHISL